VRSPPPPAIIARRLKASIVILGWQRVDHLAACLASLRAHIHPGTPHEIVIVLNGATADVCRYVESVVRDATVVRSAVNLGFAGGCNVGAAAAAGEYLVFLNDDTLVEPGWLESLIETADRHPDAGAVGSQILFPDGGVQEAGSVVFADGSTTAVGRLDGVPRAAFDFLRRVEYCSGCSLLVRRTVWDEIGGFHEDYFPAYYEDTDFCLTARARGYTVLYQPRSRVRHAESASSTPATKTFLLLRSRETFVARWQGSLDDHEPARPRCASTIARAIWRARGMPPRVLLVDDRLVPPALGSGVGRLRDIISALAPGHALTFAATDPAFHADRAWLQDRGVGLVDGDVAGYLARPDVLFDAVVLSRPHNFDRLAPAVRRHQPQAALIYDAEALYWRRARRHARVADGPQETRALAVEAARLADLEARIARAADVVTAVSPTEAAWFRRERGGNGVFLLPPLMPPAGDSSRGFADRRGLLFVAGWLGGADSPNRDGLRWFLREAFPQVLRRHPQLRLQITGAAADVNDLGVLHAAVDCLGRVPDLRPLYDSTLAVVAPVRYGAGVKIKVIEAIAHGVPVVTTTVGIEGIPGGAGVAAVADRPEIFAQHIGALTTDREAWERRRAASMALAESWAARSDHDWPAVVEFARRRVTADDIRRRLRAAG
jgi:GT2 family glycosyltransferase